MPHLRHHRRRHSWPFGSPAAQLRERRIARNSSALDPSTLAELEEHYLAPIVSEDLPEDDAASAGIVRTKTTRSHRWFASKHAVRHHTSSQRSATTSGGTGSLRRMIRPPLDKARSLFVLPTTTSAETQVVVSFWVPQAAETQPADMLADRGRTTTTADESDYLAVERNHRRCHSEQPRSWRAPSASLWTLLEE
ncbi:hypothetical protein CNMCM8980_010609 [Aspergillus fumigatiaffinis]|jgi:hypothetical protein|uniref:Uncharacterized protein n=1 Tax=Aspergillus fumigatiaffinis TaxID=340414 RepID=A0A8H4GZP5_9EURO|nr:hypothetical protein CNMCM5878_007911 [Aspergillus fumigatiaffinis]KAF4232000.1 hypothetical protein CNMCM6457_004979 [Aspergillus fumigatiaffinis]KAF4235248.1 hypothetical protein CNMCM6805_008184 [Aspergillus fumigatiaffinis]KAF4250668.1 hypothetical protein CNMCM8980_010609 [Aspergillus fumigatiaffinis]